MISLRQLPVSVLRRLKLKCIELALMGDNDPVLAGLASDISKEIIRRSRGGKVRPCVRADLVRLQARLLNHRTTAFHRVLQTLRR